MLAAPPEARGRVAGPAAAALAPPTVFEARLRATSDWLAAGTDGIPRAFWTLGDAAYPPPLLQTADPPLALFAEGDPAWLERPMLAIVGSRHATPQGLDNARDFAQALGEAGWTVVSGLATGIDGAAHAGALAGPGGTVAVVGTGPDDVYPRRHRALAARIRERGLILSEYLPGTPPLRENFPARNRVIAGLARGTLVVEAALQSGSLITARLAAEAGREVFAVPGSIHAAQSRGCHALIRQGAALVESAADILQELQAPAIRQGPAPAPSETPADDAEDTPPGDPLLDALGHDPATLDALSARTGWATSALSVRLLELELEGHVSRLPGGLFQRRAGV